MKNTRQALATLLLALLAAIFVVGCSDGSEDVDVDIEQGAVDTGVSDTDNSSSGSYSKSDFYGTYSYSITLNGTKYTSYFTFTSSSWRWYSNGSTFSSGSTWEYSNGLIFCYVSGSSQTLGLTVINSDKIYFEGYTLTKS